MCIFKVIAFLLVLTTNNLTIGSINILAIFIHGTLLIY